MGRLSARTGYGAAIRIREPGLVHNGSQGSLDRFQIERDTIGAQLENSPQEAVYFAGNFSLDGCAVFSWAVCSVCSTGRKRQIFRFSSTNAPVRVWNLRNSAISLSTLGRWVWRNGKPDCYSGGWHW